MQWLGGADYNIIRTYQAIVRAKLDYGSIFYDATNTNIKKILDPINNTGARLICGAFRTSPTVSILCEAQLPSLGKRRRDLTLGYIAMVASNDLNPVYQILQDTYKYYGSINCKKRLPKPLSVRAINILENIQERVPHLKIMSIPEYAPGQYMTLKSSIFQRLLTKNRQTHKLSIQK